ncbi:MAG: AAA family ATPase, partial [Acidaminococcaceae bacterium]|nr:AAA family ATPase [Acidaminococcaceae bacterium]
MAEITLRMKNIKNIVEADLTLPFDRGMYALIGENSCGKSTIMLALSLLVKVTSAKMFKKFDLQEDSLIEIQTETTTDVWTNKRGQLTNGSYRIVPNLHRQGGMSCAKTKKVPYVKGHCEGYYEGSIFYGCRFEDYELIDKFMSEAKVNELVDDAEPFVVEKLGIILHNDKDYYRELKKIRTKELARKYGFHGCPYFLKVGNNLINQFRMSSGESMLISLIDFINNLVVKNPRRKDKLLLLIDEVELALHPAAIDRLVSFLSDLEKGFTAEIVTYFTTHSAELIHRIEPRNIYLVENDKGVIDLENPCYPNYAVRNLYLPNGYDFVILVEDRLAQILVENVLLRRNLKKNKLCCVLPAGGWSQVLSLHRDMIRNNALGQEKKIISICDGDVKNEILGHKEFDYLPKLFLPIPSIEKYLLKKMVRLQDKDFIHLLGDKYFRVKELSQILHEYCNSKKAEKDSNGKELYKI